MIKIAIVIISHSAYKNSSEGKKEIKALKYNNGFFPLTVEALSA